MLAAVVHAVKRKKKVNVAAVIKKKIRASHVAVALVVSIFANFILFNITNNNMFKEPLKPKLACSAKQHTKTCPLLEADRVITKNICDECGGLTISGVTCLTNAISK